MRTRAAVFLLLLSGTLAAADPPPRFPITPDAEVWKRLPREEPPLPAWARTLSGPLPKTTALMLELDHLQRAKNPLGPVLAAKIRWVVADALKCDYGRAAAAADLRRLGLTDDQIAALAVPKDLPDTDRLAIQLADKLTRAAYTVTDEEMDRLISLCTPKVAVAVVHTVAYANFHNRLCLALGVKAGPADLAPPADVKFDRDRLAKLAAPKRKPWDEVLKADVPAAAFVKPEWEPIDFENLEKTLEKQKARKGRIAPPEGKTKIVWSAVSLGYQPALTQGWFDAMRAFSTESGLDEVFWNSAFWVVTRTNDCFY